MIINQQILYIQLELLVIQKLHRQTISDHLPQFLFVPNILQNPSIFKNLTSMKAFAQNINKKILYLTILTYFKLFNKMLFFLRILFQRLCPLHLW